MATYKAVSESIATASNIHAFNAGTRFVDDELDVFHVFNDGPGDIGVSFDMGDGGFGLTHIMKASESLELKRRIDQIRVTHSGMDASYRIFAY